MIHPSLALAGKQGVHARLHRLLKMVRAGARDDRQFLQPLWTVIEGLDGPVTRLEIRLEPPREGLRVVTVGDAPAEPDGLIAERPEGCSIHQVEKIGEASRVAELRMAIQREVRDVQSEVVLDQGGDAIVGGTRNPLDSTPGQSVVDNQRIRTGLDGRLDCGLGGIDGDGDVLDRTVGGTHLETVRTGIDVGVGLGPELLVVAPGEFAEVHGRPSVRSGFTLSHRGAAEANGQIPPVRRGPVSQPPETVRDALADQPISGATCLEAGAGGGNMALALREAGADRVLAVTDDRGHARDAQARVAGDVIDVIEADLTATPVATNSVDIVTAHALFNVLDPATAIRVARECTRVARPGARLIVDDYAPLPDGAACQLFDLEEAASRVAGRGSAYDFYPADHLATLFTGLGWDHRQTETLLEPLPWSDELLASHAALAREAADAVGGDLGQALRGRAASIMDSVGELDHEGGRMYNLILELSA